jgi:hypothetical protein
VAADTLCNLVVCLSSAFRWSFSGMGDVGIRLGMPAVFMLLCPGAMAWIFRTGHKVKASAAARCAPGTSGPRLRYRPAR